MAVDHEVIDAAVARAQAMIDGDSAALGRLLHPLFTWTSHRGDTFGLDDYLRMNISDRVHWRGQSLEHKKITIAGDTAILCCIAVDTVESDGSVGHFTMPMTQVWVRDGDERWMLLAGHTGPLMP